VTILATNDFLKSYIMIFYNHNELRAMKVIEVIQMNCMHVVTDLGNRRWSSNQLGLHTN